MSKTDTIRLEKQEHNTARQIGGIKRFFIILGLSLVWAFLSAMTVGSFAAAIWTVIPTSLLSWGANRVNLIGYVSHCSFAPISTLTLFATTLIGIFFVHRLKRGRNIGLGVFIGTTGGLLIGLLGGVDIIMFIGMGTGVGFGVVLGILVGIFKQMEV
ncbi:MAG: hypothetical protein AM326_08315 [Candidatus Thorarchaeota archaeon SMTZ-45]|nr:MAG: hypothetical protein AM325_09900 [Candidatus Thorarchaeota archaeon SMTZ1-45]KXH75904.1 MAG: hypothetical protein AM326_08315 [Candidatus Thorarchaeota archaeon SMTZ-45]